MRTFLRNYVEGGFLFFIGALTAGILSLIEQNLEYRLSDGFAPEGGIALIALFVLAGTIVFYGLFLSVLYGFARMLPEVVSINYLFPVSLSAGLIGSLVWLNDLDLFSWLFYQEDARTILMSVFSVLVIYAVLCALTIRYLERKKGRM